MLPTGPRQTRLHGVLQCVQGGMWGMWFNRKDGKLEHPIITGLEFFTAIQQAFECKEITNSDPECTRVLLH